MLGLLHSLEESESELSLPRQEGQGNEGQELKSTVVQLFKYKRPLPSVLGWRILAVG